MTNERQDDEYRYEKLTWPEINEAVEREKMVLIPVGSTEDHGHHLPLDVDQQLPGAICDETAQNREDTVLFQTIPHGYLPHHMDYPGGITIRWDTFVNYLIDIGVSLIHHGFKKILFVNGHGSNHHLIEQASRQINLQYPGARCAMLSWWEIDELRETLRDIRDAGPTGSGHGGEMETSLYRYLHPDRVDMKKAEKDVSFPDTPYFYNVDLAGTKRPEDSTSVTMMEWWSTISETGLIGDATVGTEEKGEKMFEAAVDGLDRLLDSFSDYPIRDINDHHSRDVADREYDPFRPR